jgi:hypothetical protein
MHSRWVLVCLCLLLLLTIDCRTGLIVAEETNGETKNSEGKSGESADWRLLAFYSRDRRITKVKIVLEKKPAVPMAPEIRREEPFAIETSDPKIMHLLTDFLETSVRSVMPEGFDRQGINYDLGYMVITTTKDEFLIGIHTNAFTFQSKDYVYYRAMYSWGLAKVVDDLVYQGTKKHLPGSVMESLSGEYNIKGAKSFYETISKLYDKPTGYRGAPLKTPKE